jgi:hypothetical protein
VTTELEPASLPIHSRAGWFKARDTLPALFLQQNRCNPQNRWGRWSKRMDAHEFFHQIVEPNCENALRPPYHLRLAWNAILSLNTVPEFIALHRLGYKTDVDRDLLYRETEDIRKKYPALTQLNNEAIKLKHVRRLPRKENEPLSSINSSTSHVISEPTLAELLETIRDAFQTVKAFPELSPINRPV